MFSFLADRLPLIYHGVVTIGIFYFDACTLSLQTRTNGAKMVRNKTHFEYNRSRRRTQAALAISDLRMSMCRRARRSFSARSTRAANSLYAAVPAFRAFFRSFFCSGAYKGGVVFIASRVGGKACHAQRARAQRGSLGTKAVYNPPEREQLPGFQAADG
jgi:hypothetical protein